MYYTVSKNNVYYCGNVVQCAVLINASLLIHLQVLHTLTKALINSLSCESS